MMSSGVIFRIAWKRVTARIVGRVSLAIVAALFLLMGLRPAMAGPVNICVLAKRGPERCLKRWGPIAEYLSKKLPSHKFQIVPLGFDAIIPSVSQGRCDFVLVNPGIYVELESSFGVSRIATLKNLVNGVPQTRFGAVVFCKASRDDISGLKDLEHKTFAAPHPSAFAAWIAAWRELRDAGMDPYSYFSGLDFPGTQDAVVYAVRDGKADAGSVRTDTLESMAREGKIDLKEFKVVAPRKDNGFPLLHTTRLYPEWPFAKTRSTPNRFAEKVSAALMEMPKDSHAAKAARIAGWTIPMNYQSVRQCLKELRLGPYRNLGKVTLGSFARQYWQLILGLLVLVLTMLVALAVYFRLNLRLKTAYQELQKEVEKRIRMEKGLVKVAREWVRTFDATSDAIFLLDKDQRVVRCNKAARNLFQEPGTRLVGSHCWERVHGTQGPIDECPFLRSKESLQRESMELQMDERWFQVNVDPIVSKSGEFEGAVHLITDISSIKRLEEERENLTSQLVQVQKMESVGRLAGGVAHDFNNMLSVIMGYGELALDSLEPGDPVRGYLEEMLSAANRSAEITRQLLAFARKQTILPQIIDLNETIEGMLKMLRRLIGENIELVWLPGRHLWKINMDPSQVDQILANLCVNARDAIDGVGKITIETKNVVFDEDYCEGHMGAIPGEYVMVAVSDNGCGMSQEVMEKVFEPFFTTKEVGKGTGMGLAMVYGIVKQNNGYINVYSEVGKGSVFKIYLLRCIDDEELKDEDANIPIPLGKGEMIIVVEDEVTILELAQRILDSLGYKVVAFNDPYKTLIEMEKGQFMADLLLTDVVMPGMSGRELSEKVSAICPSIKCIYMSGYTADAISSHGIVEEGIMFIQKPFTMRDLAVKVRDALDLD
jgi:two-component system cell cycle sensor histidine kinase/response regulator CckA